MLNKIVAAVGGAALVMTGATVLASSALAGSTEYNYHGIVIKTPQSVREYNNGTAVVKPAVSKTGAAVKNFAILDVKVVAFVGGGSVASGEKQVSLKQGKYTVRTQIKFHDSSSNTPKYVVTPATGVTVVNGGHLKVYHGSKPYTTGFNTVPDGGYFAYSFKTPGSGPCHFYLTVRYDDGRSDQLAATTAKSGSDNYVAHGKVRSKFEVQGNCVWALAINYQ